MTERIWHYGIDFLGDLSTKLQDLTGYATLANELIQNADDAKATQITFDVREDALIVENDSEFRPQDFERMKTIAWGKKREEEDTIGAFGIGFISVYQITDRPKLISSGRQLIFVPEKQEIKETDVEGGGGTRFEFPWAKNDSELRKGLRRPVPPTVAEDFWQEITRKVPNTLLFLRNLRVINLKRNGKLIQSIQRSDENEKTIIKNINPQLQPTRTQVWQLFKGAFHEEANQLRIKSANRIESKRRVDVTIAIPEREQELNGLLYAFLPTQQETGLPFHINADFFPSSDRKRVLLNEGDYRSQWNEAAIRAAANLISLNL